MAVQPYVSDTDEAKASQNEECLEEEDVDDMQPIYQNSKKLPTFNAVIRVNIRSKAEALEWLENYQAASYTDWRTAKTFKEHTKYLTYKVMPNTLFA